MHIKPTDPTEAFFDAPSPARNAELTQARLREVYQDGWRAPRTVVSAASNPDNPKVLDNGVERALHDILVSNTFGWHPMFGTGHVLRTNGVICLFWNGEAVRIVEHKNVTRLPVVIAPWAATPKARNTKAKRLAELLDLI